MAELKPCSDCKYHAECSWGWCDNIKDRYYDIRDGKGDCWVAKECDGNG